MWNVSVVGDGKDKVKKYKTRHEAYVKVSKVIESYARYAENYLINIQVSVYSSEGNEFQVDLQNSR